MYFFNNHEDGLSHQEYPSPNTTTSATVRIKPTLFTILTGEENRESIGSLLLLLIVLLHLWGVLWFLQLSEPITLAQPLMMEMSLVAAPGLQPTAEPPAPPKPVDPIKPKQKPVKKPVKKPLKKKKAAHKQDELPKPTSTAEELLPVASLTEAYDDTAKTSRDSAADTAPTSASGTSGKAEPYSEASFNANYGTNPKPKYPDVARSRGWQGKVLLRVSVTAEGLSESVNVYRSSGHDVLDESAVAAVEKWQFIPAKRGNTNVSCTVFVPIIFTLNP